MLILANAAFSPDRSVLNFCATATRLQCRRLSPAHAAPNSLSRPVRESSFWAWKEQCETSLAIIRAAAADNDDHQRRIIGWLLIRLRRDHVTRAGAIMVNERAGVPGLDRRTCLGPRRFGTKRPLPRPSFFPLALCPSLRVAKFSRDSCSPAVNRLRFLSSSWDQHAIFLPQKIMS